MAIKSQLEQPASVPIVAKSAISRQTRSMSPHSPSSIPFVSPPPPVSFNWCAPLEADNEKRSRSRKSQLQIAMEQCDKSKARDAKRRAEEKAREDKAIALQLQKERRAAEKEAERKRKDEEAKRQQEEREAKARQVQAQRAARAKEQAEQKRVKDERQRRARERKAYEQEIARAQREAERIRNAWKVPKWRSGGAWMALRRPIVQRLPHHIQHFFCD